MLKNICIILLLLSGSLLMGQSAEERFIELRDSVTIETPAANSSEAPSRVKFNMMVGTGFSYSKGFGSGMGFYAAPMITLPVSYRLSMHAGVVASSYHQTMDGIYNENAFPTPVNSLALFAAASYRMNDKLTVYGSGMKNLAITPGALSINPNLVDNFSLGASYRLGNNLTVGATITVRNGGFYNMPYPYGSGYHFGPYPW